MTIRTFDPQLDRNANDVKWQDLKYTYLTQK